MNTKKVLNLSENAVRCSGEGSLAGEYFETVSVKGKSWAEEDL